MAVRATGRLSLLRTQQKGDAVAVFAYHIDAEHAGGVGVEGDIRLSGVQLLVDEAGEWPISSCWVSTIPRRRDTSTSTPGSRPTLSVWTIRSGRVGLTDRLLRVWQLWLASE